MDKLNVKAFGLASGILWSACTLFCGISAALWGYGAAWVKLFGSFYIGYQATLGGAVIGAVWGFFDGLIGAMALAWLYNKFSRK